MEFLLDFKVYYIATVKLCRTVWESQTEKLNQAENTDTGPHKHSQK